MKRHRSRSCCRSSRRKRKREHLQLVAKFNALTVLDADMAYLCVLAFWGCPACVVQLVRRILPLVPWHMRATHDSYEQFAGKKEVSVAFALKEYTAIASDIQDSEALDICSDHGFVAAIMMAIMTKWGGFFQGGPVCSSMVFLCRRITQRCWSMPSGNSGVQCVAIGNMMHERVVMLVHILDALGIWWIIEQPITSVMACLDAWQDFFRIHKAYRKQIYMRDFALDDSHNLKPVFLWSNFAHIAELDMFRIRCSSGRQSVDCEPTCIVETRTNGTKAITGIPQNVKRTQVYPEGYGDAVSRIYRRHEDKIIETALYRRELALSSTYAIEKLIECLSDGGDEWQFAKIDSVFEFLRGLH